MRTLNELQAVVIREGMSPEDTVYIHHGSSDDHEDGETCWCNPLILTGKEFMESSFDY